MVDGSKFCKVAGYGLRVFSGADYSRHFAKQNNLPPFFFIKRLTAFSAKRKFS
jgi:hypothetical protein